MKLKDLKEKLIKLEDICINNENELDDIDRNYGNTYD